MEANKSLFSVLKDDVLLSLNDLEIVKRKGYSILIVPNSGAWTTIADTDIPILQILAEQKKVEELKNLKIEKLDEIANDFFYSGILKVNDKDISMINTKNNRDSYNIPSLLILKYTNACNLKCDYCYYFDKHFINNEILPNEYIYKMVNLLKNIENNRPCICFHGGEPLLRFNALKQCISELKRTYSDIEFSVQTNGTLLTPSIAEYFKKEAVSVGISLDGIDEETNELRLYPNKKSTTQDTLFAIENCIDAGISPGIISVLTKKNCVRAIDIIKELSTIGVKAFHFNCFFPGGRGEDKEDDLTVTIEELIQTKIKILLYINDYNSKKSKEEHISERHTRNLLRKLAQIDQLSYMCAQSPCGSGRKILTLVPNGDIYPCDDFSTDPFFRIGNINTISDLQKTLSESKAVKLCQSHCVENISQCRNCVFKRICISHCCSDSYHFTGKFNSPHSTCGFVKQFIPKVIDLLYTGRIQIENLIN